VISVGNLALGGTGKTPVTVGLAMELAGRGIRGAILTRGFGSRLAGPLVVNPADTLVGDEARLMAGYLADFHWPVIQSRRRTKGLAWLASHHPDLDVVIAEDAYQTAGLGRHLDILILDRWKLKSGCVEPVPGPVFPLGPYRESRAGADRADIWLLESAGEVPGQGTAGIPVATFSRRLELRNPQGADDGVSPDTKWAALAGIARPDRFERGVTDLMGRKPHLVVRPGDHVDYTPRYSARIAAALDQAGADLLVTTAKDWVKLSSYWDSKRPVRIADLGIAWGHDTTLPELVGERLDVWLGQKAL